MDPSWVSRSELSLGDQLYTARGSQSAAMGSIVTQKTEQNPENFRDSVLVHITGKNKYSKKFYKKRPIWTMKQVPYFNMKDRDT